MHLHLLGLQGADGQKQADLHLALCSLQGWQVQEAPPVSAPAAFPRGGSHNDQAAGTRGLEGGTKTVKGLSALCC